MQSTLAAELDMGLPSPSFWWVFMWRRSWSWRWKLRSHPGTVQVKRPLTSWVRLCLDRLEDSLKPFPQTGHFRGLRPEWTR